MSQWSPEQRSRLALERAILRRKMPQLQFYNPTCDTYVEGWASTTAGANRFKLMVALPPGYPYEKPGLYVTHPKTLWRHGGRETLNSMGKTHAFHTEQNDGGDCVEICYIDEWDVSITLFLVFLRGAIWCEAFDQHLRTGRDLAEFLC